MRCDRCGTLVALVGGKEFPAVERLTARQVGEYFPVAAADVELHEVVCGGEGGERRAMSQGPIRCLTCRSGPGVRRGNYRPCYDRHAHAVGKGKATWAELERQGLVMPAETRGQKWMAGFNLRDRK